MLSAAAYAAPIDTAQVVAEATVPTAQVAADSAAVVPVEIAEGVENSGGGLKNVLKNKFIEGNASFMSLVALALVLGLAFCIERIIYLSLSEINAKKFMREIDAKIEAGDIEGAKTQCRNTRGPVASICYQGLLRVDTSIEDIERSVAAYGTVQAANLEKGCSWITLFIAMAPSLGFLGTVIGMVMAFEQIQIAGDINPTIVAAGMKVALITTIFGIIVEYHFVLRRDAKCERVLLRHILRPVRLLFLAERWQLAHKSAVHIHRRGDEEECEQHERNVGCGCRVKRRYRVFSAFYQHLVIMFYKPN